MPWSNNNNGGWKSGGGNGGGPWGQGPGGGRPGGQQPDLEELLKRSQDRLKRTMSGGGGLPGPLILLVGAVAAAVVAFFAFTVQIKADEQGIVLRFGKYQRSLLPGLNYRLPYPIEQVLKPQVTRQNRMLIGFRSVSQRGGFSSGTTSRPEESLMLTGDENIVDIDFVVFWRIADARKYLFNIQKPRTTVKEVAESAMREVIGTKDIAPILTSARGITEGEVRNLMQKTLDSYGAGIEITQLQMQKVDPPKQVIDAYRDVQAARADEERLRNEATAYQNRVVAEAKGQADRITAAAAAYKAKSIADATGQAKRFDLIYQQYKLAKDVTRRRMFLETMERVLKGTDKIILDSRGGQGVVPYLPLKELNTRKSKAGGQ